MVSNMPHIVIVGGGAGGLVLDRKSTRLNSSHVRISYAVFCLKKKNARKLVIRLHSNPKSLHHRERLGAPVLPIQLGHRIPVSELVDDAEITWRNDAEGSPGGA